MKSDLKNYLTQKRNLGSHRFCRCRSRNPLVTALQLDDVVMDIEVTSNRVDCMSVIGQAREGAAVIGCKAIVGVPLVGTRAKRKTEIAAPNVIVQEKVLCPKYSAVRMEGVVVAQSPWWLQKKLLLADTDRSITLSISRILFYTNTVSHFMCLMQTNLKGIASLFAKLLREKH